MDDRLLSNEIRLLLLFPHEEDYDSPVKCDREVVSLENDPRYEALSYVWGKSDVLFDIEVGDSTVSVTQNLHASLKRLRLPHHTRSLWIDQLCINQRNTKEKTKQVCLMREIYAKCQRSLLWIGEIPESVTEADAEQGLDVLRYMAALVKRRTDKKPILPGCLKSDAAFDGPAKALELFARKNPWWERVWTV